MNCGVGGPEQQELLYVNFNQDYTCLAVGTRRGFRIYNCEPFGKCYSRGKHYRQQYISKRALL